MKKLFIALSLALLVGCASSGGPVAPQNNARWNLYDVALTPCPPSRVNTRDNPTGGCGVSNKQLDPVKVVKEAPKKVVEVVKDVLPKDVLKPGLKDRKSCRKAGGKWRNHTCKVK